MNEIQNLKNEIENLKKRNEKVDADKAWETSTARKVLIAILTYLVIVIFFYVADFSKPFLNAIVPTLGFLISTFSVSFFKRLWLKNR